MVQMFSRSSLRELVAKILSRFWFDDVPYVVMNDEFWRIYTIYVVIIISSAK
jgi:hypothetical protein